MCLCVPNFEGSYEWVQTKILLSQRIRGIQEEGQENKLKWKRQRAPGRKRRREQLKSKPHSNYF